jgi:hypothetical protein
MAEEGGVDEGREEEEEEEEEEKDSQETGKELDGIENSEREGDDGADAGKGRVAPEGIGDEGGLAELDLTMDPVDKCRASERTDAENGDARCLANALDITADRTAPN